MALEISKAVVFVLPLFNFSSLCDQNRSKRLLGAVSLYFLHEMCYH